VSFVVYFLSKHSPIEIVVALMEERRLSDLLALRERILPSPTESVIVNDLIPLLVTIKKDLDEIKARLRRIEEKLSLV
jgi:hypothetical protein